jgi:hypothetical protein
MKKSDRLLNTLTKIRALIFLEKTAKISIYKRFNEKVV